MERFNDSSRRVVDNVSCLKTLTELNLRRNRIEKVSYRRPSLFRAHLACEAVWPLDLKSQVSMYESSSTGLPYSSLCPPHSVWHRLAVSWVEKVALFKSALPPPSVCTQMP